MPRCQSRGAAAVFGLCVAWGAACGDEGDAGTSSGALDAAGDSGGTAGTEAGSNSGAAGAAGSAQQEGGGGSSAGGGAGVGEARALVDAVDAEYAIELGGQIDAMLGSQHPGDPTVTYEVGAPPSNGELLHVDEQTGRFVYTSLVEGTETFEFTILESGQPVDSATITLTTAPLDFVGEWEIALGGTCMNHQFTVALADGGELSLSPVVSACIRSAAGVTIYSGPRSILADVQSLGVNWCVTDIRDLYECYAFRYWRISSRGDFQTIETVSGSVTIGGVPNVISGSVSGVARRVGDTAMRAAVARRNTPNVLVGAVTDATPQQETLTLENKGQLPATLGEWTLPSQVSFEGGFPGPAGTCGTTLDANATCAAVLTVTPTEPATGTDESVPLSIRYADDAGFDVTRLRVTWTWLP